MTSIISLNNVSKIYPVTSKRVISDFNLEIPEGEFFCLVGPSGCGKSTVLKLISGLEQPTSGQVTAPKNIGMVFQSGALLPWLTVEENVAFGLKMQDTQKQDIENSTLKYIEMVGLLEFRKKYPRDLSGGQRQRVGIARALAIEPEVLLLDEPFSALDPLTTDELHKDFLKIWQETKKTIVMVSHLFEEAVFFADKVGVIKEGKLVDIINISLPRPRSKHQEGFMREVLKIEKVM